MNDAILSIISLVAIFGGLMLADCAKWLQRAGKRKKLAVILAGAAVSALGVTGLMFSFDVSLV